MTAIARCNVGAVFGWVFCAHQLGAALAAYLGGVAHDALGDYTSPSSPPVPSPSSAPSSPFASTARRCRKPRSHPPEPRCDARYTGRRRTVDPHSGGIASFLRKAYPNDSATIEAA